jgi:UDP-N-acetyl-D-galactosamine dehydrogenase
MRKDLKVLDAKVLLLGFTFKENCPDIRNTRIIDIYKELRNFDIDVDIYDPWASAEEVKQEYGIDILTGDVDPDCSAYSGVILGVAHKKFENLKIQKSDCQVVFDVKGILDKSRVDGRL